MKSKIFLIAASVLLVTIIFSFTPKVKTNTLNGSFFGRSSYSPNQSATMNITTSGNTVTINTLSQPSNPSDESSCYFDNGLIWTGNNFEAPSDGQKWWIIPFDNNQAPQIISNGTGNGGGGGGTGGGGAGSNEVWTFECHCGMAGDKTGCKVIETLNKKSCKWDDACKVDCCQGVLVKGSSIAFRGSVAVLPAEILIYNGQTYQ